MLVSRYEERPKLGMWPIELRNSLPTVMVPLSAPDPDVPLDLQAVLNATYDEAGYEKYIYEGEPEPPLSAADAVWAARFRPKV